MEKAEITPGGPSEEEIQEIDRLAEEGKLKSKRVFFPLDNLLILMVDKLTLFIYHFSKWTKIGII